MKINKFKKLTIIITSLLTIGGLVGCSNTNNDASDKNEIIIGYDNTFVPMGYLDENGDTVGFDVDLATEALKDIISNKQNKSITIDLIQDVVAAYFNLRVEDLKSQRRTRNVAYPRQIAMYLSRKLTDMSLPKIGEEFGGRDHTTVIHAYEKISETLNNDESLEHTINDITKKLTQK